MRNLQKQVEKIYRKLALKIVRQQAPTNPIEKNQLSEYVGKPIFPKTRLYPDETPVGVVIGLAWTSMGGK